MVTARQADANIATVVNTCDTVTRSLGGIEQSIRDGRLDFVQRDLLDARANLNRALRVVRSRGFGPRASIAGGR